MYYLLCFLATVGIDEEDNFAVVDVKADPNRRNTQNTLVMKRMLEEFRMSDGYLSAE